MSKFSYCAPCFSGECGFCVNCCGGIDASKENHNDRRAKSLKIIMGKDLVEEYRQIYNKRLNEWCKTRKYKDPYERGYARGMIRICDDKYILPNDKHNNICDNIYCRMLYHSSNEWEQRKRYPNYPIYTNDNNKLSLCGVCLDRS